MFYPKYNYSKGLIRPAGRRVAAVSRTHSQQRRANSGGTGLGGMMGAGGGSMTAYSPVYERAEDPTLAEEFLPTDTQTQNKIFRNIIMFDPVAGPATEYWRDLAFSKHVRLGGIKDPKILQFYQDAIEASGIEAEMPWLLNDYLTFGRFVMHMDFDDRKGYWTQLIVHDLDYDETADDPSRHGLVSAEKLDELGFPEEIVHAVKAHNEHVPRESAMDRALYSSDPVTGLIVAAALMHPTKKLAGIDVDFVMRRFGEKRFAAGADRGQIQTCSELGLGLEQFIGLAVEAMQGISDDLGL